MRNIIKLSKKHWKAIGLILYILSPIDLIPDFILPVGIGDDSVLTLFAVLKYLKNKGKI